VAPLGRCVQQHSGSLTTFPGWSSSPTFPPPPASQWFIVFSRKPGILSGVSSRCAQERSLLESIPAQSSSKRGRTQARFCVVFLSDGMLQHKILSHEHSEASSCVFIVGRQSLGT